MMEIRTRDVRNYVTLDGREPYEEWVNSCSNPKTRAIIQQRIRRLDLGNFGDYKMLRGSVRTENPLWTGLSGVSWDCRLRNSHPALRWD